jgi:peptide/nickel transport system permease protein
MIGVALRRFGWSLVVVWFVITATFLMISAIPADPTTAILGPHATPEARAEVRQE